jgi:GTP cyclohydrolase I
MIKITYQDLKEYSHRLALTIENHLDSTRGAYSSIYAIPRGGVPVALLMNEILLLPMLEQENQITSSTLIVDDICDSGRTLAKFPDNDAAVIYKKTNNIKPRWCLFDTDDWIEFPYEQTARDEEDNIVRMLETLGEDVSREGLRDTPKRVMKFYREFLSPEKFNFTTFEGESYDEMIIQKDIPFFSLCEHHLAPFFGTATVAYIPDGKIVGLSKLARTVDLYARRFQNQERITSQIAERLTEELNPLGVAVILKARHFCMEMRGIKTHDVSTTTSKLTGVFKDKPEARAEFMSIAVK